MGRLRQVVEPLICVDVIKTCPFCESTNVVFKYLNNKSIEQPRYKCLGCTKYFTHNPYTRRRKHPQGYLKAAQNNRLVPQVQDLHATVVCPRPECGKVGTCKFLYFNNGKVTQPRYKCGACKMSFTQGGRLRLKRKSKVDAVLDVGESCGNETIGQPWVLGNANKNMKLSSRKEEPDDSSDESEEEIDEDEMARLYEMGEMDRKRHIMTEVAFQDEDLDEECEEPIEFVDVVKPCNWCKSSSTTIHKVLKDGKLWEYQCEDCGGYLKFDGESQTVLPIARQSQNTKYNLRCTRLTPATNQVVTL